MSHCRTETEVYLTILIRVGVKEDNALAAINARKRLRQFSRPNSGTGRVRCTTPDLGIKSNMNSNDISNSYMCVLELLKSKESDFGVQCVTYACTLHEVMGYFLHFFTGLLGFPTLFSHFSLFSVRFH